MNKFIQILSILFIFSTAKAELFNPLTEDFLNFSDVTTNDFSTTKHGLVPKGTGTGTAFLRDDGTWAVPAGGGGGGSPAGVSGTVQYNNGGAFGGATNVSITSGDLTLATSTNPSLPASGSVKIFGRSVANRMLPAIVGSTGQDTSLQPFLARNKIGLWLPSGNSTTVPAIFGMLAITATGTVTARNIATTNSLTRMKRIAYVSAATAGALAGVRVASAQYTTGDGAGFGGFHSVIRFAISDAATVTGARMFVGLSSATGAPTNVEPNTLTNSVGICQLSTDATQLYICYGGSAAQTAIALGATNFPISTTQAYEIALFSPINATGTVHWLAKNLNNGVEVTGTISGAATVIPQATTLLTHQLWRTNNATLLAVGLDICSIYIEQDL